MRTPASPDPRDAGSRIHGGPRQEELAPLGLAPQDVIDFSSCLNPYGPSRAVIDAVRAAPLERYPDPAAHAARVHLARALGVDAAEIVLGNGATELLWTLAHTLLRPRQTAAIVEPTFAEFRAAALATEARVVEWRATASGGFAVDLQAVSALVRETGASVLSLCAPNNPTGVGIPIAEIASLAAANPRVSIVVDQAFLSLSEAFADASVRLPANVLCVRSLTKEQAIPGVRVGYLLCRAELAARVEARRAAWTTGAAAQAAAIAACGEPGALAAARDTLFTDREWLRAELRRLRLDPLPSTTIFFLVRIPDAEHVRRRLLVRHRILVRDCASFGLGGFIRVAVRTRSDGAHLIAALAAELSG